jgi:hypothetical protein
MKPSTVLCLSLFAAVAMMPAPAQAQIFTVSKDQMIELTAQNPFERFPDGRPKVPDALIQRARGLPRKRSSRSSRRRASATSTQAISACCIRG